MTNSKLSGEQFRSISGATQGMRYDNALRLVGHPQEYHSNSEPGQMMLEFPKSDYTAPHAHRHDQHVYPQVVGYGEYTQQRAHDPLVWNGQMALRGTPKPSDPVLHRLRQANPNLNDYEFKTDGRNVSTRSKATGKRVGKMDLGWMHDEWVGSHPGHREVEELAVAPDHQGKGLAEGMYDYMRGRGVGVLHASDRSESGESFARRVGGPAFNRKSGHGQDHYLGLPGQVRGDRV